MFLNILIIFWNVLIIFIIISLSFHYYFNYFLNYFLSFFNYLPVFFSNMEMAFCPSVFKLSLWHFVCFPWWVPSLVRSISVTLRQFYFFTVRFLQLDRFC